MSTRGEDTTRETADRLYEAALFSGLTLAEVFDLLKKWGPIIRQLLDLVAPAVPPAPGPGIPVPPLPPVDPLEPEDEPEPMPTGRAARPPRPTRPT